MAQHGMQQYGAYRAAEQDEVRGGRTQEEIEAQLLARYRELQTEAERRRAAEEAERLRLKCSKCRWAVAADGSRSAERGINIYCSNALIRGFGEPKPNADRIEYMERYRNGGYSLYPHVKLCGPEKALWEPIPSRWRRLLGWLSEKIGLQ